VQVSTRMSAVDVLFTGVIAFQTLRIREVRIRLSFDEARSER